MGELQDYWQHITNILPPSQSQTTDEPSTTIGQFGSELDNIVTFSSHHSLSLLTSSYIGSRLLVAPHSCWLRHMSDLTEEGLKSVTHAGVGMRCDALTTLLLATTHMSAHATDHQHMQLLTVVLEKSRKIRDFFSLQPKYM